MIKIFDSDIDPLTPEESAKLQKWREENKDNIIKVPDDGFCVQKENFKECSSVRTEITVLGPDDPKNSPNLGWRIFESSSAFYESLKEIGEIK